MSFPFTDDSSMKLRPALVVSGNRFNNGEDVIVVPMSSTPHADDSFAYPIRHDNTHFRETGLRRTSYVKWTKVLIISKNQAQRRLGHLSAAILAEVRSKIQTIFQ
ncbi:MAG: type II toxin-antitoxin system PemK/MazF family toxin [Phycisphaerae bacterium]|nr:type II toxin-antitoxin system PemK/MazF family toxin [Phycisphaerae bacterium]